VKKLFSPLYNLTRSAEIQQSAMAHASGRNWIWLYNHSSSYVSLVLKTAQEARHEHASNKPHVGGAPG